MGASVMIAAAARRAEQQIVESLRSEGATRPERAASLPDLSPLAERRLGRLLSAQVVRETRDGYWLDEAMYAGYRSDKRSLALVMLGIAIATGLGVLLSKAL